MCFQNASCVCSSSWQVWQTIQKLSPERQNSPSFVYILLFLLRMRGKPIALTPRGRGLRFIIIYINVLLAGRRTGLHLTWCTLCGRYIDKFAFYYHFCVVQHCRTTYRISIDCPTGWYTLVDRCCQPVWNPRTQIENNKAVLFKSLASDFIFTSLSFALFLISLVFA